MNLPSKELLSEVLGHKVKEIRIEDNNIILISESYGFGSGCVHEPINIYELMNRAK